MEFRRVLLKISGEIIAGGGGSGLSKDALEIITEEISETNKRLDVELAVVVGGGNILRGINSADMGVDRVTGDYMGMLATVINALAIQSSLEKRGLTTRVLSAIPIPAVCEPYVRRRAIRHLEKGRVVIFAGGTGNPYFSTDTAAVLRAIEINAQVILKGTKVDGVYTKDPLSYPDAEMIETTDFARLIQEDLRIVDPTACTLCKENNISLIVFNFLKRGNLLRVLNGERVGTRVLPPRM